jgi:hypothetical protein
MMSLATREMNQRFDSKVIPTDYNNYNIESGVYKHFKGGIYEVLGVATQHDKQNKLVIYRDSNGFLHTRSIPSFLEYVKIDNKETKRFTLIELKKHDISKPEDLEQIVQRR